MSVSAHNMCKATEGKSKTKSHICVGQLQGAHSFIEGREGEKKKWEIYGRK